MWKLNKGQYYIELSKDNMTRNKDPRKNPAGQQHGKLGLKQAQMVEYVQAIGGVRLKFQVQVSDASVWLKCQV